MPPKRPTPSKASGCGPKREKKVMTFHEKVQLLNMPQEGKRYAAEGRCYVVKESTIRYIKKNEVAIRSTVEIIFYESAKKITTVNNKHFVRMESTLALRTSNCKKKNIPLSGNIFREKARKSYQQFDRGDGAEGIEVLRPLTAPEPKDFQVAKGRFDRFQKRFKIKCVSLYRETVSGDKESVKKYLETFKADHRGQGIHDGTGFQCGKDWLFLEENTFQNVHNEGQSSSLRI
ncbi:transposable element-derived 1-like [Octopus vulgaris]|uniref:Transposable element-derived 1-like n=1 Tax=Octopus vulgaris TaxID=6645 RepID=A0AA36BA44_OCTVU|nr:transposable element-derived 1-like [Octopus vulgaris]